MHYKTNAILYFLSWETASEPEKSNYCLVIKSFWEFSEKNMRIFLFWFLLMFAVITFTMEKKPDPRIVSRGGKVPHKTELKAEISRKIVTTSKEFLPQFSVSL